MSSTGCGSVCMRNLCGAQTESLLRKTINHILFPRQKKPVHGICPKAVSIFGEGLGCVSFGIYSDRNKAQLFFIHEFILKLFHLGALDRTGVRAIGVDKIADPYFTLEFRKGKLTPASLDKRKVWHGAKHLEAFQRSSLARPLSSPPLLPTPHPHSYRPANQNEQGGPKDLLPNWN